MGNYVKMCLKPLGRCLEFIWQLESLIYLMVKFKRINQIAEISSLWRVEGPSALAGWRPTGRCAEHQTSALVIWWINAFSWSSATALQWFTLNLWPLSLSSCHLVQVVSLWRLINSRRWQMSGTYASFNHSHFRNLAKRDENMQTAAAEDRQHPPAVSRQ